MGKIVLNNTNSISNYQPTPNLFFDVEGKLIKNSGKDVEIKKEIDGKPVIYKLRLREEISGEIGENIVINRENISDLKVKKRDLEEKAEVGKIIENLNLEFTEEYDEIISKLIDMGVIPNKENIEAYKNSKNSLEKVVNKLDSNVVIRLMEEDLDFEEINIHKLAEIIEDIELEEIGFSVKEFLNIEGEITYKDAERIAEEIYGQKMGKDIYDVIIALDKENVEINRENVDKFSYLMKRIHNLAEVEGEDYVKLIDEELDFTIDNLYKVKNSYTKGKLAENFNANKIEDLTIVADTSFNNIVKVLEELNIEASEENINISREFLLKDMPIVKENISKFKAMEQSVEELLMNFTEEDVINLESKSVKVLEEDIDDLLKFLNGEEVEREKIAEIQGKDLVELIKRGEDFTLSNIEKIKLEEGYVEDSLDHQVVDLSSKIVDVFYQIGEKPKDSVLESTVKAGRDFTLQQLYENKNIENKTLDLNLEEIETKEFILTEYVKARNNITTSIVKSSIKDGLDLLDSPIREINRYIESKINRYKEIEKLTGRVNEIYGDGDRIFSMILKNDLPMNLSHMEDIKDFLSGDRGISRDLEELIKIGEKENLPYLREIKKLQENISREVKRGTKDFERDYLYLIDNFLESNSSFEDENRDTEYLETWKKISKKDRVIQIPIELDGRYEDLNLIIPNRNRKLNKNEMNFALTLNTNSFGNLDSTVEVRGRKVFLNLKAGSEKIVKYENVLKDLMKEIGYEIDFRRENYD